MRRLSAHKLAVMLTSLAVFTALAAGAAIAKAPEIRVPSEAWVQEDSVFLGDVAVISGLDSLSHEIKEVYLGRAPAPGKRRSLRGAMIQAKLDRLDLPENAVIEIPSRVKVHRSFQEVDDQDFEDMLIDYLNDKLPVGHFEVSRFQVRGNGAVAEGMLDVVLEDSRNDEDYGQISLKGIISVDGKMERRVSIAAWVDYEAPVVVAARKLDRMDVLTAGDVTVEMRNLSRLPDGVVTDPKEVRGMRLRQDMDAGEHMLSRMLEKPPLVERGEDVTIMAENGVLSITAIGLAKESGGLGDAIEVENKMSEKIITCRVTGPAQVEVTF